MALYGAQPTATAQVAAMRAVADEAARAAGAAVGRATQCFYCRRGMHSACTAGEFPCRCCVDGDDE
jgi:hypothetical protein